MSANRPNLSLTAFFSVIYVEVQSAPVVGWTVSLPRSGFWRLRSKPGSTEAYAFALVCVALATLIRACIGFLGEDIFTFAGYYPAVLFATYVGGARVGIFTALLGGIVGWWAFLPPHFAFFPVAFGVGSKLLAYLLACALIIWGADRYRRLLKRLEDEENLRKLAVGELAHRLKNKIATIQSIISFQLRDNPQIREAILGRLTALSATDDMIMATQGQGAGLRDILTAELGPYEASRVSMHGSDLLLPPKIAMTIALIVHELTTNAAKYGALSSSAGRLTIRWSMSEQQLTIDWRESGGPTVAPSSHRGFGTRLLSGALEPFSGTIETMPEPTGLVCKMSLVLPEKDRHADVVTDGVGIAVQSTAHAVGE